ncbi:MAG: X-Pro aminopeptidase [Rhodobacterales bacterium]|nr:MAG: X-Pro aminopeptidase [Rhodobacterales bacterium]
MFQTFEVVTSPETGPKRLARLRKQMAKHHLDGFLVPRADAHQGEYVADHDARLAWLTGFTGSAGFCAALQDRAGVFVDGRYRTQVKSQIDLAHFTPVDWPETSLVDWLKQALAGGGVVGFDAWLHTVAQVEQMEASLKNTGITLKSLHNLVDDIWEDQPERPKMPMRIQPEAYAGQSAAQKYQQISQTLQKQGCNATILSLPDSICWLLNIRGSDIARNPVVQGFALFRSPDQVDFFTNAPADPQVVAHLGETVRLHPIDSLLEHLGQSCRDQSIQLDPTVTPLAIWQHLQQLASDAEHKLTLTRGQDPCLLPKACKNPVEIAGARAAHLRDGAAMVRFLHWLDDHAGQGGLTEIDVVQKLEQFRRDTNALRDISFDTICGSGLNGAIVHYRVDQQTNRALGQNELLLVDSGGQYIDGTTDITRTVAVGAVSDLEKTCFTRVLQGMIAISRARFPVGIAGRDLDSLARYPLWLAGQDYDHGTGHGVGAYLSVHEGPQRISRASHLALQPGMILSNEPGYYREEAFGIRIENLIVVQQAPALERADDRAMLSFETLTYVPIDRRLIRAEMLSREERDWLDAYHAKTLELLLPELSPADQGWLRTACKPL